jgi:hypothetical protein
LPAGRYAFHIECASLCFCFAVGRGDTRDIAVEIKGFTRDPSVMAAARLTHDIVEEFHTRAWGEGDFGHFRSHCGGVDA